VNMHRVLVEVLVEVPDDQTTYHAGRGVASALWHMNADLMGQSVIGLSLISAEEVSA